MNETTQPKSRPLTDREVAMLLAPAFEPDWILPFWFYDIGGWDSAGIKW
jgi:hypothetical protein